MTDENLLHILHEINQSIRSITSVQRELLDHLRSQHQSTESFRILEPVRLVLTDGGGSGRFLCQMVKGCHVAFDHPIEPDKTQQVDGYLRSLELVRSKTSKGALPFSSPLVVTIATSPITTFRISIGNVDTVASRSLMAAIANMSPADFLRPVRLVFEKGTGTYLVSLRLYDGSPASPSGASIKGMTPDADRLRGIRSAEEQAKICELIERSFVNFGGAASVALGQATYWSTQTTELFEINIAKLNAQLYQCDSVDQLVAVLSEVRQLAESELRDASSILAGLTVLFRFHEERVKCP